MDDIVDQYFSLEEKLQDHFGYEPSWSVYPFADYRDYFWYVDGKIIRHSENKDSLINDDENNLYDCETLGNDAYVAGTYVLIPVDTRCDGNCFLAIFDMTKQLQKKDIRKEF